MINDPWDSKECRIQEYHVAAKALNEAHDDSARQKAAIRYVSALIRAQMPVMLAYDKCNSPVIYDKVAAAVADLQLPCAVHEFSGCGMGC